MRVHFIAIGGAAMHNLAIALHNKGYHVTGSDDEIFDPSKTRLSNKGLLPPEYGWFPEKITSEIDAIILGMHARENNPELIKAQGLGLKIFSYPEYIYEQTKNKTRIVIGGSHGKTSITSMILHVLNHCNLESDFMVGAQLEGFDCMVKLTEENRYAVLEGDEYLSSPIDRRPKFHLYKPNIAVLSGIAWDHINVFPTFEIYKQQFSEFIKLIEKEGHLIYCSNDSDLCQVVNESKNTQITHHPYSTHAHKIESGKTYLEYEGKFYPIRIFGNHNLQNLNAALHVCLLLGIEREQFYDAIASFKGASNRLELLKETNNTVVYKDFAHSPSKLKATVQALKNQFKDRKLIACMELHTFSSLNKDFLKEYQGALNDADEAVVFYSPHTLALKKMPEIAPDYIKESFGKEDLNVFTSSQEIEEFLKSKTFSGTNLLMMSSGNFGGINLKTFIEELNY
jgi:UDP-N-acetylmuramate: L-alanyl-gamma-D-glutamyl-meso-diaminopimelate ligase